MKDTQITYPTLAHLEQSCLNPARMGRPPSRLALLNLLDPKAKHELHYLQDGCVVLFKRTNSDTWQVRFRLYDRKWHRFSTHHRDLSFAKRTAGELYDRAKFKEELGIPLATRGFGMVAEACIKELDKDIEQGIKPMTNKNYKQAINRYLIPFFGKYHITKIDSQVVKEFEAWRKDNMGRTPVASTLMNQASDYNRVITTAIENGWISANIPIVRLSRKGVKSTARPAFTADEIEQMLAFLPQWELGGRTYEQQQIRLLLRDYIEVLLATGARCGKESMNMLWQHIQWYSDKEQRYLRKWVSGKTGGRWLIAKHHAAEALGRLAIRRTALGLSLEDAIAAKSNLQVFTYADGSQPYAFQQTFTRLLVQAGLSADADTGQKRTLYSLRHTHTTFELLSGTDIHTLARQMGTSVNMLEWHYSMLTATLTAGQLA